MTGHSPTCAYLVRHAACTCNPVCPECRGTLWTDADPELFTRGLKRCITCGFVVTK